MSDDSDKVNVLSNIIDIVHDVIEKSKVTYDLLLKLNEYSEIYNLNNVMKDNAEKENAIVDEIFNKIKRYNLTEQERLKISVNLLVSTVYEVITKDIVKSAADILCMPIDTK